MSDPKQHEASNTAETEKSGTDDPLAAWMTRRHNAAHKERRSRDAYAYGVDVRRTRWFTQQRVIGAALRAVERGWHAQWSTLRAKALEPDVSCPEGLLRELARCVEILGAPTPAISCLRESAHLTGAWPTVTPLGTSHGDMHHLVLDLRALALLSAAERRFAIASALGHLQCDHGVLFTAALRGTAPDAPGWIKLLLRGLTPITRIMCFSADRAGLLCSDDLEAAMEGMRQQVAETRSSATRWLPASASFDLRVIALREFHQSDVYARVTSARVVNATRRATATASAPPTTAHVPDDAWSVTRVDQRLTQRLGLY